MNYYVVQVKTGGEEKFMKSARIELGRIDEQESAQLIWPRRKLKIRRKGKTKDELAPIFPGYVFVEAEAIGGEVYWSLRRSIGFYRFLKNNRNIQPLAGQDRELLVHFLHLGEVVEKSRVYFDENNRIRVSHGALKGLEGYIVKVDKRKRRAKVRLSLYDDSFLIDFGFELMESMEANEKGKE
jgi:transcription termination/antitermination protein NusG